MSLTEKQAVQILNGLIAEREACLYLAEALQLVAERQDTLSGLQAKLDAMDPAMQAAETRLRAAEDAAIQKEASIAARLERAEAAAQSTRQELDRDLAKRQAGRLLWEDSLQRTEQEHVARLAELQTRIETARTALLSVTEQVEQVRHERAALLVSLGGGA